MTAAIYNQFWGDTKLGIWIGSEYGVNFSGSGDRRLNTATPRPSDERTGHSILCLTSVRRRAF